MLALVEKMKAQVAESEEKIILANKKAEEHLAQVTASTEANNKMLEAQVKMMSEQLNPSLRETYFARRQTSSRSSTAAMRQPCGAPQTE